MDTFQRIKIIFLLGLFILSGCSGGGGGDGGIDGSGLSGTAAVGDPIRNTTVVVKGANGQHANGVTDDNGKFNINVDGLTSPYVLKVRTSDNRSLYALAKAKGIHNIHPVSDVVARNWFKSKGRDIDDDFGDDNDDTAIDFPSSLNDEIDDLIQALTKLLLAAYADFDVDELFNFQYTSFNASSNDAFDRLLDHLNINIKQDKITIVLEDPNIEDGEDPKWQATIILNFNLAIPLSDPDIEMPATPTGLVAFRVSDSQSIVVWNPSTDNVGVAGYRVYRDGGTEPVITTAFPVFSDAGLDPSLGYCYTVEAFDGAGLTSPLTTESCIDALPIPAATPTAVTNLVATVESNTEISLNWTPSVSDDVIGYDIWRGPQGQVTNNAANKIATVVSSSLGEFNLEPQTKYCYIVRAFGPTGLRSADSEEVCATTLSGVSGEPDTTPPSTSASVPGGNYNTAQSVSLICDDGGGTGCAAIYYTTDGSIPDTGSDVYMATPLTISSDTTLRFMGVDNAGNIEVFNQEDYVITGGGADIVAPATSASPVGGLYFSTQNIVLECDDGTGSGCAEIYYTTDGSIPDTGSTVYSAPININSNTTLRFFSVDNAGNAESAIANEEVYVIDIPPPLTVDVSVMTHPVVADETVLYTITVGNTTALPIDNVSVSLVVPAELSFYPGQHAEPDAAGCSTGGCTAGEQPTWNLGTLAAGGSRTITIDALVNTSLLNDAIIDLPVTVSATGLANNLQNKIVSVNNNPSSDLALSASADPVVPGETFTFNVDVGNTSGGALTNVELRATLPAGVSISSVSDGGTDLGNGEVSWTVTSLGVGQSLHREVTVTADAGLIAGQILHADLALTHDGGLPVDNTAEHVVTVVDTALPLNVDIATSADPVVADNRVLYTITVSNSSLLPVNGVSVLMRMPAELSFYPGQHAEPDAAGCSTGGCTATEEASWNLGTLAAGESRTITVDALVDVALLDGNLIAIPVRVTATGVEDVIDRLVVVRVNSDPMADLALSASTDPVVPGETFTFNVDVGNTSGAALTNMELRTNLPAGLTVDNVSNGGMDLGNGNVVWNITSLAVGQSLHREITVIANGGVVAGQLLHSELALRHDNGLEIDNTTEHVITVQGTSLPLNVDIATSADPVVADDQVLYTITVSNDSLLPVNGVSVLIRMPAELSFYPGQHAEPDAAGCSTGGCTATEEASWNLGTLAAGESRTITVDALADVALLDGNLIAIPVRVTATGVEDVIDRLDVVRVNSDPLADLALSASADPVVPGETFTFNVDVGNTSGGTLTNVQLFASLPAGITIDSISDGGSDLGNGEVSWPVTSLASGTPLRYQVTVTADGVAAGDIIDLHVELYHDGGVVELDNSAEFAVSVVASAAQLSVIISATPDPVVSGNVLSYIISVSNDSLLPVDNVTVMFRVPAGLSFNPGDAAPVAAGCSTGGCTATEEAVWNLGTIAAGTLPQEITIPATVAGALNLGTLISVPVRVTADQLLDTINLQHVTVVGN